MEKNYKKTVSLVFIYYLLQITLYILRYQKYKNKELKNNLKTINISINDMDKFEKK